MIIGIISDTHDRHALTLAAIDAMKAAGAEVILHCGDIESVQTVELFKGIPTHFVRGNWDWNVRGLADAARAIGGSFFPNHGTIELAGRPIAWLHSHQKGLLRELTESGIYDYVFHGHTHDARVATHGKTTVICPGAMFKIRQKRCGVLNLATGEYNSLLIPDPVPNPSGKS